MALRREQGFTLIEAAVAIAVVAILSGIIAPLVVKNIKDSQVARARNDVQVIAGAIGSQYKDTGSRPTGAGTGASSGLLNVGWFSGATAPSAAAGGAAVFTNANNTFTNLFTQAATVATAQTLFGFPGATLATAEFAYKGPYMSQSDALKNDPWGTPYMIVGYNAAQQTANGPIYVVSAGPDQNTLVASNMLAVPPAAWIITTTSADDIVVRVN